MTKIFISYRRDDSADIAGRIYDWLVRFGPFERNEVFKDDAIPLGVNFKKYLESQVALCQIELVIIGKQWASITDGDGQKRLDDASDFVRIEVEAALSRGIPVIPLLVGGASMPNAGDLPHSLRELVYYNGTPIRRDPDFHHDMDRLITSLQQLMSQNAEAPAVTAPVLPAPPAVTAPAPPPFALPLLEWITIPAGHVVLEDDAGAYDVAPFAIAKYPVTNEQYQAFVNDDGYTEDRWWQGLTQRIKTPEKPSWSEPTQPRETVSWYEAMAFTRWLAHKTNLSVTLPTEVQWQWAAVGDTGWSYAYGPTFDRRLCTSGQKRVQQTTPVNFFDSKLEGKTQFGVMDMSGNVWEWCLNPNKAPDSAEIASSNARSVRGGAWNTASQSHLRVQFRYWSDPAMRGNGIGFRCVYLL